MQAKSIFLFTTVVFVVSVWLVSQFYPQAPKDGDCKPVKTKNQRRRDSSVKCWVYVVAEGSEDNGEDNVLNNFPPNNNNHKCNSVLFQKSLQLIFREVA